MSTRGTPFQQGNKFGRGRPKGSRNKTTRALQQLLNEHAEALMRKCVLMALQGDITALRLCISLLPARRQAALQLKLPPVTTTADIAEAHNAVLKGVTSGKLTPAEGQALASIVEARRRVIETQELEARLQRLEEGLKDGEP